MGDIALLIISLGIILIGAEIFVNGVEWLGKLYKLSEGAVGSVLAAVGTALPETLIPIIAILFGSEGGHEIGIGAILGAPLMLSTLAMFVTGVAVYVFKNRRKTGTQVHGDYTSMSRDLGFFMVVFTAAIVAGTFTPQYRFWQIAVAFFLIFGYVWYVRTMLRQERDIEADEEMPIAYFARGFGEPPKFRVIVQVLFALFLIILGAHLFVGSIKQIALIYAVPAFVLSIIITPIATELPEKFNSIIWISREKDTLALGNITGAMVFQGSMIPAIGIFLTDWQLTSGALTASLLALASTLVLYIHLVRQKHITAPMLLFCGLFYVLFLVAVFTGIIS